MERYKNLGGNSDVVEYEIGDDFIDVKFNDGWCYLYNYQATGSADVEHMKKLAIAGQGLNSFIGKVVKKRYASKHRCLRYYLHL